MMVLMMIMANDGDINEDDNIYSSSYKDYYQRLYLAVAKDVDDDNDDNNNYNDNINNNNNKYNDNNNGFTCIDAKLLGLFPHQRSYKRKQPCWIYRNMIHM